MTNLGMSFEIVWISVCYDLILFGLIGFVLGLAFRTIPRMIIGKIAIFILVYLVIFDWITIALDGRTGIFIIALLTLSLTAQVTRWLLRKSEKAIHVCRISMPYVASLAFLITIGTPFGMWLKEEYSTSRLPRASATSPNILVIVMDTLRADHLSTYGYARNTSPNIDRIASQGVLFENAISTSSWTWPAHASLITGSYTYEHGAELKPLDNRLLTIGEALQPIGYRTGAFSANVQIFNRRQGFGRGFVHFEDYYQLLREFIIDTLYGRFIEYHILHNRLGFNGEIGRKRATEINESLLKWIDRDRERPFFILINYNDIHDPYTPPQPYRVKYSQYGQFKWADSNLLG